MNNLEGLRPTEILPPVEGLTIPDFEYLQNTEGLAPGQFEGLSLEERYTLMRTLESKLALIQGRPAVPITLSLTPGENGHYDPQTRSITLNAEALMGRDVFSNIDTIAHEGRHAYQHYAIEHPGFHPNPVEVQQWAVNFEPNNYRPAELYGGWLYRLQPIEADAFKYGNLVKEAMQFGTSHPVHAV